MKIFTNLPGNLRALFGFLRFLTIMMAVFWLLTLTFNTWIQNRFMDEPKLIVTMGEISLPATVSDAVGLSSDTAKPGSLGLVGLRGRLQMDLCSKDAALVSALRWTMIPSMVAVIGFSWLLFGSLRNLCANIERGDVFSEKNLRLVRGIGLTLIAFSLIGVGLEIWGSHVLSDYFSRHVTLTGLQANLSFTKASWPVQFSLPQGLVTNQGGLVTGCLVLVVAEAFRQGLKLKAENDLTV